MNIPSINNNTTPIDMLPYLDDIESNKQGMHSSQPDIKKIQNKFLKNNHYPPSDSGMNTNIGYRSKHEENNTIYDNYKVPYKSEKIPQYEEQQEQQEQQQQIKYKMAADSPSCITVAEHIANCPICSKFYNNDKTPYIIAIIILLLVCVLLIKKVLDC
jgi:hypothetical protein